MDKGKLPLRGLNVDNLSFLLDTLGKEKIIFQSEAQFQFDLAWKLQELYDCKVLLEDLSVVITKENDTKQKIYTDIVLLNNDYAVAIELKYKTASLEYNGTLLFNHGASDLGRYDYLWDVNRLELLVDSSKSEREKKLAMATDINVRRHCDKGFAILLTNDDAYWEKCWWSCKETMEKQFCIGSDKKKGNGQLYSDTLDWAKKDGQYPKTVNGTARGRCIQLNHRYDYQWKEYCTVQLQKKSNMIFKYTIIETKK